jgi:hypothetical protein
MPSAPQIRALFRTSGGSENLCSGPLRDLDCCKSHTAGGRVNQDSFAGGKTRRSSQRVIRSKERDRQSGSLFGRNVCRF